MSELEQQGWVPYSERGVFGQKLTDEFHEMIGTFGEVGVAIEEVPERCLWAELEVFHFGRPLPRIWQRRGSCVGAGGWCSGNKTFFGDYLGGDDDAMTPYFPWAPYGKGRQLGGLRAWSHGSFGPVQAKAMSEEGVGLLPYDDSRFPQPKVRDDIWWYWEPGDEDKWSHPSIWPISERDLAEEGRKYAMQKWTKLESVDDCVQMTAQGRGITLASSFGSVNMRVRDGFLTAEWNDTWYHQMSYGGYAVNDAGRRMHCIDNQWTKSAHPQCPELAKFQSNGSFWISDDIMQRICDKGEVYGFAMGGFTERRGLWS